MRHKPFAFYYLLIYMLLVMLLVTLQGLSVINLPDWILVPLILGVSVFIIAVARKYITCNY